MATFKIGQRVRIVRAAARPEFIGLQATVLADIGSAYEVDVDGHPAHQHGFLSWIAMPYCLAPLTDPSADAFMERIKKLKPYDEPLRQRTPSMLDYAEGLSPKARAIYLQELREMFKGPPHCGKS